ncbi:MAG TPA: 30S ribosomal protein S6 [Syntrophobacteraceae bacterium]|nr:30S ribosomal protein S6 [Syntrophobacteraceae bacterium]
MRKYETFFIVDPDLPDEVHSVIDDKLQSIVQSNGGMVLSYVPWGKRKLAYPIKKRSRGLYVLMEYAGGSKLVAELERNLRLDERIIKFLTVKLDDKFDPAALEAAEAPAREAVAEVEEAPTSPPPEEGAEEAEERTPEPLE